MSRHHDEQYRWAEALRARIVDLYSCAEHFKMTQAAFLDERAKIMDGETRLTREMRAYVDGYQRALSDRQIRGMYCVRRIVGRPETATSAKWDDMTEEMREACRAVGKHLTETCLAWDPIAAHPFGPWTVD